MGFKETSRYFRNKLKGSTCWIPPKTAPKQTQKYPIGDILKSSEFFRDWHLSKGYKGLCVEATEC
jgi:hypothetical protein